MDAILECSVKNILKRNGGLLKQLLPNEGIRYTLCVDKVKISKYFHKSINIYWNKLSFIILFYYFTSK